MSSVPISKRAKSGEPSRKTSASSAASPPDDARRRGSKEGRPSSEASGRPMRRASDQAGKASGKPASRSAQAAAAPEASSADWPQVVLQFMRNLFVRQVSLQRKGGDLHVVLRERDTSASGHGAASAHSAPMPLPSSGEAKPTHATLLGISSGQLKRMRHQLSAVLDLHPATRSVFPHLNYLDKSLRRHGADCFRDLPVEVLHKALKQLDSLVQSAHPGPAGLAELRACLVVSAVDRGGVDTDPDAQALALGADSSGLPSHLSDFNLTSKLSVHEVSQSDFEAAHQQWEPAGEVVKLTKS